MSRRWSRRTWRRPSGRAGDHAVRRGREEVGIGSRAGGTKGRVGGRPWMLRVVVLEPWWAQSVRGTRWGGGVRRARRGEGRWRGGSSGRRVGCARLLVGAWLSVARAVQACRAGQEGGRGEGPSSSARCSSLVVSALSVRSIHSSLGHGRLQDSDWRLSLRQETLPVRHHPLHRPSPLASSSSSLLHRPLELTLASPSFPPLLPLYRASPPPRHRPPRPSPTSSTSSPSPPPPLRPPRPRPSSPRPRTRRTASASAPQTMPPHQLSHPPPSTTPPSCATTRSSTRASTCPTRSPRSTTSSTAHPTATRPCASPSAGPPWA